MSKLMLITGGSQGIGESIAEYFKDQYQIVTVSRSNNTTEQGDLTDHNFRNYLVEKYTPNVFINNAGVISDCVETYQINTVAACHLATEFYKKMTNGNIFNMSSIATGKSGSENEDEWRIHYRASKTALQEVSKSLTANKKTSVKVTSIEPGWVNTKLGDPTEYFKVDYSKSNDMNYFAPMPPRYIAEVIDWILTQPSYVVISSIELNNFFKNKSRDSAVLM